jgi:hypothetical protein
MVHHKPSLREVEVPSRHGKIFVVTEGNRVIAMSLQRSRVALAYNLHGISILGKARESTHLTSTA